MNKTAIQSPEARVSDRVRSATAPRTNMLSPVKRVLAELAALRITVVLMALSIVLVFFGTLAQMDEGIWTVLNKYFRTGLAWIPLQIFVRFGQVFFNVSPTATLPGRFPFPGGWLLGGLLLANLLAAHAVRFKLTWKRSGILLIHAGLVVMMLSELVAGLFAIEGNMVIVEGESSNFLVHNHYSELAIVDPSNSKTDDVVVVPDSILRKAGIIQHEDLPFDIQPVRYLENSAVVPRIKEGDKSQDNPATKGIGLEATAVERPIVTGTDSEQPVDAPSAYVTLKEKGSGQSLGTYLVSDHLHPQPVLVNGKTYELSLRFKRTYKPYSLYLSKFSNDRYLGTDKPKNYSSLVRLVDPARNEDREVLISMNDPLRHDGETFYQSSFLPNNEGTILQVVRNPGWLMPYISCGMVSLGMLVHFSLHLMGFLRRLPRRVPPPAYRAVSNLHRFFPWSVLGAAGIYVLLTMAPAASPPEQMQLGEFGKIPVVDGGRVKPIDSLARNSLLIISNRQEYKDEKGEMQPAIKWLLDVMTSEPRVFRSEAALSHKVFRIENDQVLNLLGLEMRPLFWRYSIKEIAPKYEKFEQQVETVRKVPEKQRSVFDQKIWSLRHHIELYLELAQFHIPLAIPPRADGEEWQAFPQALGAMQAEGEENPAAVAFGRILMAYAQNKPEEFNREVAEYRQALAKKMPNEVSTAEFEVFFNNFEPFYQCALLYVGVFVLACLSWIGFTQPLNRAAFWLMVLTLIVHTWALGARMYIQGRPPVTNLYSSAVWIGWGGVVVGLVLQLMFRNGIGNVVGAVLGSLTMIIAHHLASAGDTLEMMQAVLDTNFWLATHVTIVTFGYVATYVAGLLGILFILLGFATRRLDEGLFRSLGQMIYGVICFATLLSFTGTVLGGIWADQSWGRFWGWDPKVNGALVIVLWNALLLHARWAGLVKQRGLAVLAVGGIIVTTWSWFGTNQLGVGLHAYGFNNTLVIVCDVVWGLSLAFIALGSLPTRYWQSFGAARGGTAEVGPARRRRRD